MSFALVRADAPTTREVEIENPFEGEAVVELIEPPADGFAFPTGAFPRVVRGDATLFAEVDFDPESAPAGAEVSTDVRVRISGATSAVELRLHLDAELEVPSVQLGDPAVDFGSVLAGESKTVSFTIRNTSKVTPVRAYSTSSLPPEFSLAGGSVLIEPGETASPTLTYEPSKLGTHSFEIQFVHDAAGPSLELPVTALTDGWAPDEIIDFGAVPLTDGVSEWLRVDAPAHAVSVSLEASSPGDGIALFDLIGPGGQVYTDEEAVGPIPFYALFDFDLYAFGLPASDRAELDLVPGGGTYRFRLFVLSESAETVDVRAYVKNRPNGVNVSGRLDVNVFLAPGLGISAAAAPGDARLQGVLSKTAMILEQQGIELGDVFYVMLTDPGYDDILDDEELGELMSESSAAPSRGLNLFMVETAFGGGILGYAARIFGPDRSGTTKSGVIIDFDYGTADDVAYITAHESSHFLGLYHTTESDGSHDFIDDTLACPANGTSPLCATVGDDNLMHWHILSVDPLLTAGQGKVLRAHPLVGPADGGLSPLLALRARASAPVLVLSDLPHGWCGTPGCGESHR